jgi:hypothetical protein
MHFFTSIYFNIQPNETKMLQTGEIEVHSTSLIVTQNTVNHHTIVPFTVGAISSTFSLVRRYHAQCSVSP